MLKKVENLLLLKKYFHIDLKEISKIVRLELRQPS